MKPDEYVVGEAVRMEVEEHTGKVYLVFEIVDEKYKQSIKKNWTDSSIEFRIVGKNLVRND